MLPELPVEAGELVAGVQEEEDEEVGMTPDWSPTLRVLGRSVSSDDPNAAPTSRLAPRPAEFVTVGRTENNGTAGTVDTEPLT